MNKIVLPNNAFSLVSDEDYHEISQYKWCDNGNGYVCRNTSEGKIYMHRLIAQRMGLDASLHVDHINRDRKDNRRENLRSANKSLNGANRTAPLNNTSGRKGVTQIKGTNLWMAQISKDGKRIYIGVFDDKESAARAYHDVAVKLFGEYAA